MQDRIHNTYETSKFYDRYLRIPINLLTIENSTVLFRKWMRWALGHLN